MFTEAELERISRNPCHVVMIRARAHQPEITVDPNAPPADLNPLVELLVQIILRADRDRVSMTAPAGVTGPLQTNRCCTRLRRLALFDAVAKVASSPLE